MIKKSPIGRIVFRRIRRSWLRNLIVSVSVMISIFMISFFITFYLQTMRSQSGDTGMSAGFGEFISAVQTSMMKSVIILVIATSIMIRIHCRMRSDENRRILAVLKSVGAAGKHNRRFVLTEIAILFLPPIMIGAALGIFPGVILGNYFISSDELHVSIYGGVFAAIIIISTAIVLMCCILPEIHIKRNSVIADVRSLNAAESETRHSYQQSRTFREKPFVQRLAQKRCNYYSTTYNAISMSFALAILYPAIAIILFRIITQKGIVVDDNPYDGINTAISVIEVARWMLLFLIDMFSVLSIVGVFQAVSVARIQIMKIHESGKIYISLGMTRRELKLMNRNEIRIIATRAAAIFIFCLVTVCVVYYG